MAPHPPNLGRNSGDVLIAVPVCTKERGLKTSENIVKHVQTRDSSLLIIEVEQVLCGVMSSRWICFGPATMLGLRACFLN